MIFGCGTEKFVVLVFKRLDKFASNLQFIKGKLKLNFKANIKIY